MNGQSVSVASDATGAEHTTLGVVSVTVRCSSTSLRRASLLKRREASLRASLQYRKNLQQNRVLRRLRRSATLNSGFVLTKDPRHLIPMWARKPKHAPNRPRKFPAGKVHNTSLQITVFALTLARAFK